MTVPLCGSGPSFKPSLIRLLLSSWLSLILLWTAVRVVNSWRNDGNLNHVSGVWVALAADFADGVFYRPVYGELGYGGTRYFPLNFVLHGALIRLGLGVRSSGYALSVLAMMALMATLYRLLRILGVERALAATGSILVLATFAGKFPLLTIRGDSLGVALSLLGLGSLVRSTARGQTGGWLWFTLAFAAKPTMAYAPAAAIAFLLFERRFRCAARLLAQTAAGSLAVLALMHIASGGRAFASIGLCAGNKGIGETALQSAQMFIYSARLDDPGLLVFLISAAFILLSMSWKQRTAIPALLFVSSACATLVVFALPGTGVNHLLDIHVAGLVLIFTWVARQAPRTMGFFFGVMVLGTLLAVPFEWRSSKWDNVDRREGFAQTLGHLKGTRGRILAENPIVSVLNGGRPFVLDPFIFRCLQEKDASLAEPLWKKIRQQEFDVIVLQANPFMPRGEEWYRETHFGEGFVRSLRGNYEVVMQMQERYVFVLKPVTKDPSTVSR